MLFRSVMAAVDTIFEQLGSMSVLELVELKKKIEDEWGITAAAPVAVAAVEVADGVARLWGGGVLESHRGRGIYRALVATRLTYAVEHGATMALSQGNITTSSPILHRLGFISYGQERSYRLPLG